MKLYNGLSPNGARVMIFLAEKGVDVPTQSVDVMAGETRSADFRKINSLGQVPVLQLDDGRYLSESVAICRYLEHRYPEPSLFGRNAEEQAFAEMWCRRIELGLFNTVGDVGLHEFALFKDVIEQNADYAAAQRRLMIKRLGWLDTEMADGRTFIAGDQFSMADIVGMTMLMVMTFAGIAIPADLTHVSRWATSVSTRPSFPRLPQAA